MTLIRSDEAKATITKPIRIIAAFANDKYIVWQERMLIKMPEREDLFSLTKALQNVKKSSGWPRRRQIGC